MKSTIGKLYEYWIGGKCVICGLEDPYCIYINNRSFCYRHKEINTFNDKEENIISNKRNEVPCKVCKRNNDIGTNTCWHCGNIL